MELLKGHPVYFDGEQWRYVDNDAPTIGKNRPCGECGKKLIVEDQHGNLGPDPCIGVLPGVMNACCGHGESGAAYVQFPNGVIFLGEIEIPAD